MAVIVPAFGVADLVGEALLSLQAQRFTDWECIVIDDGAPDDVAGAVQPYLTDPRIRFLATKNQGVSAARNTAIAATSAPLIALLDGDDLFRPEYLATMVALLEADPQITLATCNARIFGAVPEERLCVTDKQGKGDGITGTLEDVLDRSFNVYIGTSFRRADFDRISGFDTSMAHSEDLDLWVRLLQLGGQAHYVDEILGDYRIRAQSASSDGKRMLQGNIKVCEKCLASLPADHKSAPLLRDLITESRKKLDFEHAIDHVIQGNIKRGIGELKNSPDQFNSPIWKIAIIIWKFFPSLASPMLQWRRRTHARGAGQTTFISTLISLLG